MELPRIGPSGAREVATTKAPVGRGWKKEKTVGLRALNNAVFKSVKRSTEKTIPNRKEAQKAEDVAFKFFEDVNEAVG